MPALRRPRKDPAPEESRFPLTPQKIPTLQRITPFWIATTPSFPKLFHLYVYTRRPGSSAVVPGLDHDVVRAGSHLQVSIESLAVLLILQPVIHVNLNAEHGARARDRSVNVNWRSDGRIGS